MNNRISVTSLDRYQAYLDSDMTEQEFYHAFSQVIPTIAMNAGNALHKVLEIGDIKPLHGIQQDGFTFILDDELHGDLVIGEPCQREQKHVWQGIDGVDLVGKIDVETAFAIYDHKLTSYFDPEKYFNSWQWRAYLTMRNKQKFVYQIFECEKIENQTIFIKDYHTLQMHSYKGMEQDVKEIVTDFSNLLTRWKNQNLI